MSDPVMQYVPLPTGVIKTPIGLAQYRFIETGKPVPAVVLTNHGVEPTCACDGKPVRFKFLVAPIGTLGNWQRTDAAEPYVDYVETRDPVPDGFRTTVHDALLDSWEKYLEHEQPDLPTLARIAGVNNEIVQTDEAIGKAETKLQTLRGKRKNLLDLVGKLRSQLRVAAPTLPDPERGILANMVNENCWLTMRDGEEAELHPYNSATIAAIVPRPIAERLIVGGYVQQHRFLADNRTAFRVSDRGRQEIESKTP